MSLQLSLGFERGEPTLVRGETGLYVEMQTEGVFNGFMPTDQEISECVVREVEGATADVIDPAQIAVLDATMVEHDRLFRLGLKELVEVYGVAISDEDVTGAYYAGYATPEVVYG